MTTLNTILIIALVIGLGILLFFVIKIKSSFEKDEGDNDSLLMLQNQLNDLRETLDNKLSDQKKLIDDRDKETAKILREELKNSAKNIQEVTKRLTKLDDTNKRVESFAQQLKSLESILQNPKQRGILGEYFLETLLSNVLGEKNYQMQYSFSNGEVVDAAILVNKEYIVPIDAKFSLENYNRIQQEQDKKKREELVKTFKNDLKKRIDETSKYVRVDEKTTNFAFMFIPAEGLYYDLLSQKVGTTISSRDLMQYAYEKNVIIVSPNTLFAYLQTVVEGLRRLEIQDSAKEIQKNVNKFQKHLLEYEDNMRKLGTHLSRAVGSYDTSYDEFRKLNDDAKRITGEGDDVDPMLIDRPQKFE